MLVRSVTHLIAIFVTGMTVVGILKIRLFVNEFSMVPNEL